MLCRRCLKKHEDTPASDHDCARNNHAKPSFSDRAFRLTQPRGDLSFKRHGNSGVHFGGDLFRLSMATAFWCTSDRREIPDFLVPRLARRPMVSSLGRPEKLHHAYPVANIPPGYGAPLSWNACGVLGSPFVPSRYLEKEVPVHPECCLRCTRFCCIRWFGNVGPIALRSLGRARPKPTVYGERTKHFPCQECGSPQNYLDTI